MSVALNESIQVMAALQKEADAASIVAGDFARRFQSGEAVVVMHDVVYPVSIIFTYNVWLLETGDDTVMVVQMVAALCALQTQLLEYNSSCEVSNPNELTHPSATIEVDASLTSLAPLDMECKEKDCTRKMYCRLC
nr:hypothetical protein [Tanacetum cinerariifolium]